MTKLESLSFSIIQHSIAMKKAIDEVLKCTVSQQVSDAVNTGNQSSTAAVHELPINLPLLVYRTKNIYQSREWEGPYNLLSIQGKSVIIELTYDPTKFRSISIKHYFIGNISIDN